MARDYTHTPVLSSQKLGETKYYLKDADARTILDSINDGVFASLTQALGTVAGNDDKLVTAANIKSYVDSAVSVGIVVEVVETLPTASADTMGKIYMIAQSGGKSDDYYNEYITVRTGEKGSYTYAFELIGDTRIDLSGYVPVTRTIAGIDLQDNITKADLQTALELGDMAYVDKGTFTVADYVTGVSSATTTASGTVEISGTSAEVSKVVTSGSVTAGTDVVYTQGTLPTKASDTFDEGILPSIDTTKFNGGQLGDISISAPEIGINVGGEGQINITYTQGTDQFTAGTLPTKASDTFTANTPTTIDTTKFSGGSKAADTFNAGSLPTYTQGSDSFTAATLGSATKAAFATNGIVASIDSDDECLVFTTASTASAVTEQGAFNGGSFTQGTDTFGAGSLPSFTEGAFTPAAIQSGFYTQGTAATFSEGAFTQGTLPSFTQGSDKIYLYAQDVVDMLDISGYYQGDFSASAEFTPASIGSDFFYEGSLPSFTEGAFTQGSLPTLTGGKATVVTLPTFSAVDVLTNATASFTGSASDVTVTLSTTSKTVDVNPKTSA